MENKQEQIGKIEEGYFLRQFVGNGKTESGQEFELAMSLGGCSPMVLFGKKAFILSWNDICNLAESAGLFDEVTK